MKCLNWKDIIMCLLFTEIFVPLEKNILELKKVVLMIWLKTTTLFLALLSNVKNNVSSHDCWLMLLQGLRCLMENLVFSMQKNSTCLN